MDYEERVNQINNSFDKLISDIELMRTRSLYELNEITINAVKKEKPEGFIIVYRIEQRAQ